MPVNSKRTTELCELAGYWKAYVPFLAQMAHPLYVLVKKAATWDWTKQVEMAFLGTTRAIQQAQALRIIDPGRPFELDIHMTQEDYGWGLWQCSEWSGAPIGFWSQLWKGAESRYSLKEKQLSATYMSLQVTEAIGETTKVVVKTT